ncbi:MAG: hypothetical protein PVH42_22960, partial [Desulfobacterales bacterium]
LFDLHPESMPLVLFAKPLTLTGESFLKYKGHFGTPAKFTHPILAQNQYLETSKFAKETKK